MKTLNAQFSRAGLLLIALLVLNSFNHVLGQAVISTNAPPGHGSSDGSTYALGEVLVKFNANVTDEQIARAFRGASLKMVKQIQTPVMRQKGDIGITRALTALPVEHAVALLKQLPGIDYAEPNWIYTHQADANDPYFTGGSLWGMYGNLSAPANHYGSQAAEAWAAGYLGSRSVVVGVIDEGIQINHLDLADNIWVNPGEIPGNGIDDDGNHYIDDINGWDFFEDNNSVYDGTGDDHGTHVTGTIGAVGGNSLGVAGVNWAVSIISGKFLGPTGGSTADAINAVDYFTDLKLNRGVPIVALNNSWGGGSYSQSLHDAVIRAAKAGILFVAASGNGNRAGRGVNNDSTPYYPACYNTAVGTTTETAAGYDGVIAVTAIDSSGNLASFANYGATTVDLGAPGVGINSTLPTDSYGAYSGTSMATPHVTGAVAMYASTHPGATALEIKNAILGATAPTTSLSGKTVTGGRLDLSTVITPPVEPPPPPKAPSGLAATALSATQIKLIWNDNSDNESRFVITRGSTVITVGADTTSYTDSGLSPNTAYTYSIKACNSGGCTEGENPLSATGRTFDAPRATVVNPQVDDTTRGNWIGKYGAEGYNIVSYTKALPTGSGTIGFAGYTSHLWTGRTADLDALQTPNGKSRFAACNYSFDKNGSFYIDANITDGKTHRISIYCLDWDNQQRIESIDVVDRNYGNVITSVNSVSSFSSGRYLTWDITGPVLIKVKWIDNTASNGDNAVVSGVFVDPK